MLTLSQWMFAISLAVGALLVLTAALGAAGLELDAGGDVDGDAEADGDVYGLLGVGRVPLVILAMLLTLSFGGLGLSLAPFVTGLVGAGFGSVLTLVLAAAGSLAFTRWLSRLIARVMPGTETYASHKPELVGQGGTVVVSTRANEAIVRVLDRGGAEHRLLCSVNGEVVHTGEAIVVTGYEPTTDRFVIEKLSV